MTVLPRQARSAPALVLDGELPKADWLEGTRSARRSAGEGELHTVVPGRPIGLHPEDIAALGARRVRLHFYGGLTHGQWRGWIEKAFRLAPGHLHLHAHVGADRWVPEFSLYDAGGLHFIESGNGGPRRQPARPRTGLQHDIAGLNRRRDDPR